MDDTERWQPDNALVFAVRARRVPIADLTGPDRAWLVAALTVEGWTVAAIADRLKCSLRLIQQIKAEAMTQVALYALAMERELRNQRALHHMAAHHAAAELAQRDAAIDRLTRQRDTLLDKLIDRKKMI